MISQALCDYLRRRDISFALIGAVALAVHGVARFTAGVDLLTTDRRVLDAGFWERFEGPAPVLRTGEDDDPLAGVARFALLPQHDLIVGKSAGTRLALTEARLEDGLLCSVASPLALLALKAEAGAPQDAYDARALLEVQALLGDPGLANRFLDLLPSLDQDANQFVARFRILEDLP